MTLNAHQHSTPVQKTGGEVAKDFKPALLCPQKKTATFKNSTFAPGTNYSWQCWEWVDLDWDHGPGERVHAAPWSDPDWVSFLMERRYI